MNIDMICIYKRKNQQKKFRLKAIRTHAHAHLSHHITAGDDDDLDVALRILTRIPSQRDTARNGRNARNVRIERNAGISAAPAQIAPKFDNDNLNI